VGRSLPAIGICNGFQALVRAGLLPGTGVEAALVANRSARFECRWVTLEAEAADSIWLDGLTGGLRCPVAHGEGRLVVGDGAAIESSVALRYAGPGGGPAGGAYPANPNGSVADIAGLIDPTGLVLGLMPHPEDHVSIRQDPFRGRQHGGRCLGLFRNAVAAFGG
jgi:phosphoribosylformylglycinamidine synthase